MEKSSEENLNQDIEKAIYNCHNYMTNVYPGLKLRWSRIYGKRWAHFLGNSSDLSFCPVRVEISPGYGLSIENPEYLDEAELKKIISMLKGVLT